MERVKLIECHGLRIGYGTTTDVACPDFSVASEDFLCVMGPNGSGKSTLLKTIAGLIAPRAGAMSVDDGLHDGGIGYLPQRSPLQDDFPATVCEVVRTGCQALRGMRPFYLRSEKKLAERALIRFGLKDLARRPYRSLSGGQRQRVLLARALCVPRRLLLLDEPTAGLDQDAVASLYDCIMSLKASGPAIVMVTHELAAARRFASHILRLGDGAEFSAMSAQPAEICRD